MPFGIVEFHVIDVDTPFLLCLKDLDDLRIYYDNLRNVIVTPLKSIPVIRQFENPFILWDTSLYTLLTDYLNYNLCYLTIIELKRLHRRFGHPSVDRLHKILERSGHEDENYCKALKKINQLCEHYQKYGKSLGRLKFTLKNDVKFNYCVFFDIMYIDGDPLLHVIDEATLFQAGRWLKNISAKHTWEMLRNCWMDKYLGPPDIISHDAGKNFVSKEFQKYAFDIGTPTRGIQVESHNSIGLFERCHGPLRRIYHIVKSEIPGIDKNIALKMTFRVLNDSVGPNGLVPNLLFFIDQKHFV